MRIALAIAFIFLFFIVKAQQDSIPKEIAIGRVAVATIKVDGYPDFLATDENGVWVTNHDRVEKLVFGNEYPVLSVAIPTPCGAMAIGFGSLWVVSCEKKSLYRIDLRSGDVAAIIETGIADEEGELSVAIGAGSVWLLTNSAGELSRIDPYQNKVIRKIKVWPNSFAVAFGYRFIWITNTENGSVQKIDPIKEKVMATIPVRPFPRFLVAGCGAVWTLNQGDGTVSRIDPIRNKVVITIALEVAGSGGDIASSVDKIYVRAKSTLLSVVDPITNKLEARYGPSAGSGAVRVENGRVWITAHDINTIWVLKE